MLFSNLVDWLNQMSSYQNYGKLGSLYPVNISTANTAAIFLRIGGSIFGYQISSYLTRLLIFLVYALFLGQIFYIIRNSEICHHGSFTIAMSVLPIIFFSTSFHYYFGVLIPFVIIIFVGLFDSNFRSKEICRVVGSMFFGSNYAKLLSSVLFFAALIPWVVPWNYFVASRNAGDVSPSITWLLAQTCLTLLVFNWLVRIARKREFIDPIWETLT